MYCTFATVGKSKICTARVTHVFGCITCTCVPYCMTIYLLNTSQKTTCVFSVQLCRGLSFGITSIKNDLERAVKADIVVRSRPISYSSPPPTLPQIFVHGLSRVEKPATWGGRWERAFTVQCRGSYFYHVKSVSWLLTFIIIKVGEESAGDDIWLLTLHTYISLIRRKCELALYNCCKYLAYSQSYHQKYSYLSVK